MPMRIIIETCLLFLSQGCTIKCSCGIVLIWGGKELETKEFDQAKEIWLISKWKQMLATNLEKVKRFQGALSVINLSQRTENKKGDKRLYLLFVWMSLK